MPMKATPEWLKATVFGSPVAVDRTEKVLRGYVVAQKGYFKDRRGQFDDNSLQKIVHLMSQSPNGLKSRFTHPTLSDDGLGKFLGRVKDGKLDGDKVRANLHLDASSFNTPNGNLGAYVLDLAESDPDALSTSLVLRTEKLYVLDDKGKAKLDENGEEIPPIWTPTKLHASDIVDTGDAVDAILSLDAEGEFPDAMVRKASEVLNQLFPGETRQVVEVRCLSWLDKYLEYRYGQEEKPAEPNDQKGKMLSLKRRLRLRELEAMRNSV